MTAYQVIEAGFLILIRPQSNAMSPKALIRKRGNDLPTFHAISGRELAVIGQMHELHAGTTPAILPDPKRVRGVIYRVWILCPDPCRKEHIGTERLHVTRRDVDQQAALDLPVCDRLKMVADGFDMPVALKARWLDTPPKPANKVEQRPLIANRVAAITQRIFYRPRGGH